MHLLILGDTVNNEFSALLNHDCVITLEGHVGGMLVVQVRKARECMEARASTGFSQDAEVAMNVIRVESLQPSCEMMQDLQWLVVIAASIQL
jgi:hypothetical protein